MALLDNIDPNIYYKNKIIIKTSKCIEKNLRNILLHPLQKLNVILKFALDKTFNWDSIIDPMLVKHALEDFKV
jgi:hypothetical protein